MEIRPGFLGLVLACAAVTAIELLSARRAGLPAIAAAFAVAFLTRSLLGAAFAGVAVYWLAG